eukprot:gnl/MRDRNA2_/MRDRNA2_105199_c0_seq1.p1 gnl/MRDRNA2_/MRDRNA2_105199_c0~~gnl/MRDRNA2_/MRDRNA2_105199_c0_seq1.p1  ORF type:complete len:402 (-),score=58.63 gnl/MRDRNA2_/MRDRNA2_105199_c0_seq1:50-1255(-)
MGPQRGAVRPTRQGQTKQGSLNRQLQNTKMCVYFQQQGTCKYGAKCVFAHEQGDVTPMPDLTKTRICANYEAGKCLVENCPFAHSFDELRSTDFYYKTTMCTWYAAGKCRNGAQCRFAHGESELRATEGENAATTKDGSKKQATDQSVANKKAAKASNVEQPSKSAKKGQKVSTGKEAKESSKRREKHKASMLPQMSGTNEANSQPMFIQPTSSLLHSSIPNFIPPTTRLPEYQPIPPGMALGYTPPQASFPPYAATACYPEACYPAAPQIPVVANSGNTGQPVQDIAALSASIMSLSGQIRQLQQCITPAKMEAKQAGGQSDSTNSGSNNNSESYSQSQSSGDSSPPSTPPHTWQRDAFSRSDVDRLKLEQLKWQLHLEALAQGILLDHRHLHGPQMPGL